MTNQPEQGLSLQWIAISVVAIVFLNRVIATLITPSIAPSLVESMGAAGVYLLVGLVAFVSFFVGGLLCGYFSPGETVREPALAAVVAVVLNSLVIIGMAGGPLPASIYIGFGVTAGVGFAMALAGAYVGEKLQGDTLDKMRERGEFGNDVKS